MKDAIEDYVGHRPETCPWRAMYDPLVVAAISIATMSAKGMASGVIDEDTPAVWLDAVHHYTTSRDAVAGQDRADAHKKRMRDAKR